MCCVRTMEDQLFSHEKGNPAICSTWISLKVTMLSEMLTLVLLPLLNFYQAQDFGLNCLHDAHLITSPMLLHVFTLRNACVQTLGLVGC